MAVSVPDSVATTALSRAASNHCAQIDLSLGASVEVGVVLIGAGPARSHRRARPGGARAGGAASEDRGAVRGSELGCRGWLVGAALASVAERILRAPDGLPLTTATDDGEGRVLIADDNL